MSMPTEPIGSIPRSPELLNALTAYGNGEIGEADLAAVQDRAVRDTIRRFEETGSPVVTDGEQAKPSFVTYPLAGLRELAPDGVAIAFADGHQRQLPVLTRGPFRYQANVAPAAGGRAQVRDGPVKQAVIAPSALSLLYPPAGLAGYGREAFLADLADPYSCAVLVLLGNGR